MGVSEAPGFYTAHWVVERLGLYAVYVLCHALLVVLRLVPLGGRRGRRTSRIGWSSSLQHVVL